jgi:Uma2 family endonuclease
MATVPGQRRTREITYPTTDGKPMAETDLHRDDMVDTIYTLQDYFADRPRVYVSGNLLLFYEEGNRRKHVAPDVLVAFNVPKLPPREYYLVWEEGKAPDFIVEITSKTTRREDQTKKRVIYRDVLKVPEYVLFDPTGDYLDPPLQGFRRVEGDYVPIELVAGRLPSQVLGLHLERDGERLRLFDPATGLRLPTRLEEREAAKRQAEEERRRAEEERRRAEAADRRAEEERRRAEEERRRAEQERRRVEEQRRRAEDAEAGQRLLAEEVERLRRENEALRGG